MSLILLRFARPQCLAATHSSSPEVGNGLSWPKPQCTCNAVVTSQAQHSTNEQWRSEGGQGGHLSPGARLRGAHFLGKNK